MSAPFSDQHHPRTGHSLDPWDHGHAATPEAAPPERHRRSLAEIRADVRALSDVIETLAAKSPRLTLAEHEQLAAARAKLVREELALRTAINRHFANPRSGLNEQQHR